MKNFRGKRQVKKKKRKREKRFRDFPGGTSGKESTCQCRRQKRCGFDPWVGRIFWRRKWQPTPVFLPGKIPWTGRLPFMGLQRVGYD